MVDPEWKVDPKRVKRQHPVASCFQKYTPDAKQCAVQSRWPNSMEKSPVNTVPPVPWSLRNCGKPVPPLVVARGAWPP